MFGALGLNTTADVAALIAAIGYLNVVGGGTIQCMAGRTYHFHYAGGTLGITVSEKLVIDMNGATFRRPDNVLTSTYHRMVLLLLTQKEASFEIFGGVIDANWTGNVAVAPVGSAAVEQAASIQVSAKHAAVSYVKFRDLKLLDRWQFDHLQVATAAGFGVEQVLYDNIVSETVHVPTLRADIIWFEGCKSVHVTNVTVERIETEYLADPAIISVISIENAVCRDRLQIAGLNPAGSPKMKAYLKNVVTPITDIGRCEIYDETCDFGRADTWFPSVWRSKDSKFGVKDAGFPALNVASLVAVSVPVDWWLTRPKFRLVAGPQTIANYAFSGPPVLTSTPNPVSIVMEEPDFLDDFGRIWYMNGHAARVIRPKVKQLGSFAFVLNGNAGRVVNAIIEGGDYSQCVGTPIVFDSFNPVGYKLTLLGDWYGTEGRISSSGTAHAPANIENHRRIFATAKPTSSVLGDELHIVPAFTADAQPVYIATNTSSATTVWAPIGEVIRLQTLNTNVDFTLNPLTSASETLHTGVLTLARTVTLGTTGAYAGQRFKVTRTGTGAFPLNIGAGTAACGTGHQRVGGSDLQRHGLGIGFVREAPHRPEGDGYHRSGEFGSRS